MKRRWISLSLVLLFGIQAQASRIKIQLSDFPNKNYELLRYWGLVGDTIRGVLNEQGEGEINLGENDAYRGLAFIQVVGLAQPLQVVINQEDFELKFDNSGIQFTHSPENEYMQHQSYLLYMANYKQQSIQELLQLYPEASSFRSQLIEERKRQEKVYDELNKQIASSPLYAAKLIELKQNYDHYLQLKDSTNMEQFRKTQLRTLNLKTLYTTPLWRDVISYWVSIEYNRIPNHSYFVSDAISLIHDLKSNTIRDQFANALIDIAEQYNWTDIKQKLGISIYNNQLVKDPTGNLAILINSLGVKIGSEAPNFQINDKQSLNDFKQGKVLLFFYEDGCDYCNREIALLQKNYDQLVAQNVQIISITTDLNDELYDLYAKTFPWTLRLNDKSNQMWGKYGVYMTPTYFLLDEGKIIGRYASFKNMNELKN